MKNKKKYIVALAFLIIIIGGIIFYKMLQATIRYSGMDTISNENPKIEFVLDSSVRYLDIKFSASSSSNLEKDINYRIIDAMGDTVLEGTLVKNEEVHYNSSSKSGTWKIQFDCNSDDWSTKINYYIYGRNFKFIDNTRAGGSTSHSTLE